MSLLRIHNLQHSFNSRSVLNGISVEIPKGQLVVIAGSSGAGKTTLLKTIGGLLQPDKGDLYFKDIRIKGPQERLIPGHESIKYVAQSIELMPMLTAAQNIAQGALRLMPEEQLEVANELLRLFKLEEEAQKPLRTLSGGQQQRVALARQLAGGGELFLFDEVLSQLDLDTKAQVMLALKTYFKNKKRTALFVLHDPLDTFYLADRVLILENGRLVQDASPVYVYEQPQTLTTAKLFGMVNLLPVNQARELFPECNFHVVEDRAVIRPNQLKLADLDKGFEIIQQIPMPGVTLYRTKQGDTELIVSA